MLCVVSAAEGLERPLDELAELHSLHLQDTMLAEGDNRRASLQEQANLLKRDIRARLQRLDFTGPLAMCAGKHTCWEPTTGQDYTTVQLSVVGAGLNRDMERRKGSLVRLASPSTYRMLCRFSDATSRPEAPLKESYHFQVN